MVEKIRCDVVVIGARPAGGVAAVTAKMNHPEKDVSSELCRCKLLRNRCLQQLLQIIL